MAIDPTIKAHPTRVMPSLLLLFLLVVGVPAVVGF
jgi:hypothetical protein